MTRSVRKYTKEFKQEAVNLAGYFLKMPDRKVENLIKIGELFEVK